METEQERKEHDTEREHPEDTLQALGNSAVKREIKPGVFDEAWANNVTYYGD